MKPALVWKVFWSIVLTLSWGLQSVVGSFLVMQWVLILQTGPDSLVCEMALWVCQKLMTLLEADCRGRWWITAATAAGAGFVTWRKQFKGMLQGFYYRGNFGHSKVQLLYPEKAHCSQAAPFRENTWPFIFRSVQNEKKVSAVSKPLDKSSAISPAGVKLSRFCRTHFSSSQLSYLILLCTPRLYYATVYLTWTHTPCSSQLHLLLFHIVAMCWLSFAQFSLIFI